MKEQQYIHYLTEAYKKGYDRRYADLGVKPELKMHYFKEKEDLPRVQVVLGFLHGTLYLRGNANRYLMWAAAEVYFSFLYCAISLTWT